MTKTADGQDPNANADGQDPKAPKDPKPTGQDPKGDSGSGQDPKQLTDKALRAELSRARTEAAESRIANREAKDRIAALEKTFKTALGLDDDKGGDLDTVKRELESVKSRALKAEGRVLFDAAATAASADPHLAYAVLDSAGKLDGLDFTDDKAVTDLITAALKANPKLAAGAPKKIGDTNSEPGGGGKFDMNTAIRRAAGR